MFSEYTLSIHHVRQLYCIFMRNAWYHAGNLFIDALKV